MIGAVGEFKVGTYARTKDGTGYIIGCDGGSYQVVSTERDEERDYSSSELTPWLPAPGERVVEADKEDCITGIVVDGGEGTSLVMWNGFVCPQTWLNTHLEPACD